MIRTERLNIKVLEKKHLEPLREMRNDPTTWRWLTDVRFISELEQEMWFEKLVQDRSKMYLAIEDKFDNFVGVLRSDEWDKTNRSVRVGSDIARSYRGQGYGTEALGSFIDYLFKQQNMHRIWLLVSEGNDVAKKLYKRLGFKEEGRMHDALYRNGKYWDYISMRILENEWKWEIK
jgi:RimJ/RimL family protein N-acetyltransferase